jgi:leucyl aminopeptidase
MLIRVEQVDATDFPTPLLAVMVFEGEDGVTGSVQKVDERVRGIISDVVGRGDFKGKEGETLVLYVPVEALPAERLLLVGVGKRESLDLERLRRAAGSAVKQASRLGVGRLASLLHHADEARPSISPREAAQATAEGAVLGSYVFDELKTPDESAPSRRVSEFVVLETVEARALEMEAGATIGAAIARGANLARTLGNLPGNIATPTYLAETGQAIARDYGMKATILGPDELRSEGMHALLAVSQGSEQEPRLIVLEHRRGAEGQRPIALVGKGLTFDSGGISIKPAQGMEEMKFDMCGGAAVLGAMQAIGELGLEVNVVGIVPCSENLLSGSSLKPGDIIRSHLGKSIEIINTDAEGRLILADALSYLRRFEPTAVVDAATLTGACVIALGHQASGAFGNDENLIEELRSMGDRVGERVWPLPMYPEYREQIKSEYADIKNSGGRSAGAITAAWFLREFVGEYSWVHLDIAGTAFGDGKLAYLTKGATGAPTRLMVEWVRSRAS